MSRGIIDQEQKIGKHGWTRESKARRRKGKEKAYTIRSRCRIRNKGRGNATHTIIR